MFRMTVKPLMMIFKQQLAILVTTGIHFATAIATRSFAHCTTMPATNDWELKVYGRPS